MRTTFSAFRARFALRRRIRVTFEGKWFLLLIVGTGTAAINTGNNLLYIALCMNLSLIVLSGILSEWSLRGVAVSVRHASEAFASREGLLAVTCSKDGKRFPALSLTVSLAFEDARLTVKVAEIPPGGSATRVLSFLPPRRGPLRLRSCTVSTLFPFALFEKTAVLDARASLLVYPEPEEQGKSDISKIGAEPSGIPAFGGRHGTSIRGVRKHLPADPVRDIHWKASARLGQWMVKERERESSPVSDLRLPAPSPPSIFERLVSRACASVLRCEREGRPYRLWHGDRLQVDAPGAGRRTEALTFLALVRPDGSDPGPE